MGRCQQQGSVSTGLNYFSLSLCSKGRKKNQYLGSTAWQEHHFRIEVAVRHCHLVTFVRHCTFKPSFFSPSSSFHSFLPRPIVWIPLVTFYVAIWKFEGKRSSARESLWNQLVDWCSIYFCLRPPSSFSHFILLSPQTSIVLLEEFICSVFAFSDTRQGQGWCLAFLWTVSLPVCKWNPLGTLVGGCEKLEILTER